MARIDFIEDRPTEGQAVRLQEAFKGRKMGTLKWGNQRLKNVVKITSNIYYVEQKPPASWSIPQHLEGIQIRDLEKWQSEESREATSQSARRSAGRASSRRTVSLLRSSSLSSG